MGSLASSSIQRSFFLVKSEELIAKAQANRFTKPLMNNQIETEIRIYTNIPSTTGTASNF